MAESTESFEERLHRIRGDVGLAENFVLVIGRDFLEQEGGLPGRFFYQVQCWRKDVITGEMGMGYGGKAYLSPHATDSELVQTIFGLYKGYWEHEARETFTWRERRVFGPHTHIEAAWEAAKRVDVRSARHVEDTPNDPADDFCGYCGGPNGPDGVCPHRSAHLVEVHGGV